MEKVFAVGLAIVMMFVAMPVINVEAATYNKNEIFWFNKTIYQNSDISGQIIVNNGATLTIPSNVTVTIKPGATLAVNGNINIRGKLVVENGGKFYRKEYGIYQEIIGPDDKRDPATPLLKSIGGSIIVDNNGFTFTKGSQTHVARSSIRLPNESWKMEHESELVFDDNVSVDVTIYGPDFSQNTKQFSRVIYGFGSSNSSMKAQTPNTYYCIYDVNNNSEKWMIFNGLLALAGTSMDPSMLALLPGATDMLTWADTFSANARSNEPALTEDDAYILKNQVYDSSRDTRNQYNLYIPKNIQPGQQVSLILFTHGGSWTGGAKEDFDYGCAMFTRQGYVTATIDYRLFMAEQNAATSMEDILNDMELCVNTIAYQVESYGITIDKMATSGYSAGGHLALLYAYSRKDTAVPVELCFEMVGPADFTPEAFQPGLFQFREVMNLFANKLIPNYENMTNEEKSAALRYISPTNYIDGDTVPTVCTYATQDIIVGYNHGLILDDKLTQNGVDHVFLTMPKSNHTCEFDSEIIDLYFATSSDYCKQYLSSSNQ